MQENSRGASDSDCGGTWYPEACVSLGLEHRLHSSYEKSIVYRKSNNRIFQGYNRGI